MDRRRYLERCIYSNVPDDALDGGGHALKWFHLPLYDVLRGVHIPSLGYCRDYVFGIGRELEKERVVGNRLLPINEIPLRLNWECYYHYRG